MDEADLRKILARQTNRAVELVDVLRLDAAPETISPDAEILLFDTLTAEHLQTIGRLLWQRMGEGRLFSVASSGLEYALGGHLQSAGQVTARTFADPGPAEPIVVVSGSCSPVTARQITWAASHGFALIALNPSELVAREQAISAAALQATDALDRHRSVILHTALGPDDPRLAPDLDQDALGRALAVLIGHLVSYGSLRRVAITGGDTSGRVARALGIVSLSMVGPMAPGSPLCRATCDEPHRFLDGLEIVFKGGQVGRDRFFGDVLRGRPDS